eukprot:m.375438 g.375438  ORF g.375438 m.375438 type:complete len:476 (+) comp20918_c0_seq1:160-1587(+)
MEIRLCFAVGTFAFIFGCGDATHFLSDDFEHGLYGWTKSSAMKGDTGYDGPWTVDEIEKDNHGLVMSEANRHYALSKPLTKELTFEDDVVVIQYSVKYQKAMECGGSYLKLLSKTDDMDLTKVKDDTPYTILFGPDKCGGSQHLRFIFRHLNPSTGEYREVHARPIKTPSVLFVGIKTHLVTLVLRKDNTFSMSIDEEQVLSGALGSKDEFDPSLMPPKTIDDPSDSKPEDWVDEKMIDDPEDPPPADWVTEATVLDPDATQPDDWDEEMDGEWEAPTIANPAYKGPYNAKKIENPAYKGVWMPKQLPNPEYFEERNPYGSLTTISAAAFELWTTTAGVTFDDIIITNSEDEASAMAATWRQRRKVEDDEADATMGFMWRLFRGVASALMRFATLFSDPQKTHAYLEPYLLAAYDQPLLGLMWVLTFVMPVVFIAVKLCGGKRAVEPETATSAPDQDEEDDSEEAEEVEEDKKEK